MASVKYGSIVTELKGKVAGHVYQKGSVGYALRTKGYSNGTRSSFRQNATTNLIANTTTWRTLSSVQKTAWQNAAALWPFVDKFGNTYFGTGYQVFNAYNSALNAMSQISVSSPHIPVTPVNPGIITITTLSSSVITLDVTNNGGANDVLGVFASGPVSAGRNTNNVRYRLLGYYDYSSGTIAGIHGDYLQIWGALQTGQQVVFKCVARSIVYPLANFPQTIAGLVS